MRHLGDLLVVAPRWQQTTMGRAFPRTEGAGRIEPVCIQAGGARLQAYGVTGSPAQAVAHAVLELAERDSDIYALCIEKVISVTPISWDMSANAALDFNLP